MVGNRLRKGAHKRKRSPSELRGAAPDDGRYILIIARDCPFPSLKIILGTGKLLLETKKGSCLDLNDDLSGS